MGILLEVGLIVSALFVLLGIMSSGAPIVVSEEDGFTQAIVILWALCTVVLVIMYRLSGRYTDKRLKNAYRAWALGTCVWASFVFFIMIFTEETTFIQIMVIMWSLYTVTSMIIDRRRVKRLNDA